VSGARTCEGCGDPLVPWRDQTLVVQGEEPVVVRRLFRCPGCGAFRSLGVSGEDDAPA
jgi:RNase P subunit RPR2